jgi:hypothetical protein
LPVGPDPEDNRLLVVSRLPLSAVAPAAALLFPAACGGDTSEPAAANPVCSLPPQQAGFCLAYIPRFSFNAASGRCEGFVYGGCGGNANNFATPAECVETCAPGTSNACAKTDCLPGAACVFVGVRRAACLDTCADAGSCSSMMTCQCGGSCPGCNDCTKVCAET